MFSFQCYVRYIPLAVIILYENYYQVMKIILAENS
jgi:hypothetical protein